MKTQQGGATKHKTLRLFVNHRQNINQNLRLFVNFSIKVTQIHSCLVKSLVDCRKQQEKEKKIKHSKAAGKEKKTNLVIL